MFQTFTLDNSLLGPMSPWTKVFLDLCPLDKVVLGPLSLGQMYQHRKRMIASYRFVFVVLASECIIFFFTGSRNNMQPFFSVIPAVNNIQQSPSLFRTTFLFYVKSRNNLFSILVAKNSNESQNLNVNR